MISCPGCGAGLRFDIETQAMRCDYCGSSYDPYEFDPNKGDAKKSESFDTYVWTCPSCGGQLETPDKTDAMGFCPYCGGASLLYDQIRKQWPPATVIPFSVTKEQCKKAYLEAAKKHPFVSRRYKDPALLESFRGIYMPYWSYRLRHRGTYSLSAETSEKREGDYMVAQAYQISGEIDMEVDGYAHDASVAFDDRLSEDLAPFKPEGRKPFTPGFLSGFYTVVGDQERDKLDERVMAHAEKETLKALSAPDSEVGKLLTANKLKLKADQSSIPTEILEAEHTLYPVWFMSYRQGDKVTYAAVNGQTGKVSADFPASPLKLLALAAVLAVFAFAILMLGPSVKAGTAAFLTSVLFAIGTLVLHNSFHNLTAQSEELAVSPEVALYKRHRNRRVFLTVAFLFFGIAFMVMDLPHDIAAYLYCGLLAVVFVLRIRRFIKFQLEVAKRRPPQMNRKGAQSDEN